MSLNFVQLCESVLTEFEILEEADKATLDKLSRQAYQAYLKKEQAKTQQEANIHIQKLVSLRDAYIIDVRTPGLYANEEQRAKIAALTDDDIENFIKTKAKEEVSEHPRVHGTHFLTSDYLSQYVGSFNK